MSALSNEEIVRKSAIVADDIAAAGKLNDAQSDKFIDFVIDETMMKGNARQVRFRNENLTIDKIGVGRRVTVPKNEAQDPGVRRGITTSKLTLTPSEIMTPFEIGDNFNEINIEGDSIEEHIIRMMATQTANDIEDGSLNGNKLGPAVTEDTILPGGSTTQYVKDSLMALWDGWAFRANGGNVVDAAGANIGLSVFSQMLRAMPTKFRRNLSNLRWYMSPDMWQLYVEKLATRATPKGDEAVSGNAGGPFGIPAVPVPLWPFQPKVVEHLVLNGTTVTALRNANITNVVVTASTLGATPTTPFIPVTDYVLDAAAGTIARDGGGAIGDGATVKVTYDSSPQLILTHKNNMIIGIGRDVRIEKDRDIFKGLNQYAITTKVDFQIEELEAVVKAKNIGTGV